MNRYAWFFLVLLLALPAAAAPPPTDPNLAVTQSELAHTRAELTKAQGELAALTRELSDARERLGQLEVRISKDIEKINERINNYLGIGTLVLLVLGILGWSQIRKITRDYIRGQGEKELEKAIHSYLEKNDLEEMVKQRIEQAATPLIKTAVEQFEEQTREKLNDLGTARKEYEDLTNQLKNDTKSGEFTKEKPSKETQNRVTSLRLIMPKVKREEDYTAEDWFYLGLEATNNGNHEKALACYDRSIKLDPELTAAHFNKGTVLGKLGRHKEALAAYERAIELKPDFPEAHNNKGVALGAMDRHKEALNAYDRAIELDPNDAGAYHNKGVSLAAMGQHEKALAAYERAIELKPDFPEAYHNKGEALAKLNRQKDARDAYKKAIEQKPDYLLTHQNLTELALVMGENEKALRRARELKPKAQTERDHLLAAYLLALAQKVNHEDASQATAELDERLRRDFQLTNWDTAGIEGWAAKADLEADAREFILEQTARLKAKLTKA